MPASGSMLENYLVTFANKLPYNLATLIIIQLTRLMLSIRKIASALISPKPKKFKIQDINLIIEISALDKTVFQIQITPSDNTNPSFQLAGECHGEKALLTTVWNKLRNY